jgi:transcriptional regulator with XRE-family HTH domain
MSASEMADYLDVGPNTVSTWINGRVTPSTATAKLWALRTGVPYTWLCHGNTKPCDLGPRDITAGQGGNRRRSDFMQKMPTRVAS